MTTVLRESTDSPLAARLGGRKVRMTTFSCGTRVDALVWGLHELGEQSVEFVDRGVVCSSSSSTSQQLEVQVFRRRTGP